MMRKLPPFEYHRPGSLEEAVEVLGELKDNCKVIAGGTDLLIQMKYRHVSPNHIVSLKGIPELAEITEVEGNRLRIGALVTHAQLLESPIVKSKFPVLIDALGGLGSCQVRNIATIGGNICNASPAADSVPSLLVLETECMLMSAIEGERSVALEHFLCGPGCTILNSKEILKAVNIPIPERGANRRGIYLKLGRRKSMDLAIASVALLLDRDPDTKLCARARVALGSVSPTAVRAYKTEEFLQGKTLNEGVIHEAGEIVRGECDPISDIRASAYYRKEMVEALLKKAIKENLGR